MLRFYYMKSARWHLYGGSGERYIEAMMDEGTKVSHHYHLLLLGAMLLPGCLTQVPKKAEPPVQINRQVIPLDIIFSKGKSILKQGPHNKPQLQQFETALKQSPVIHIEIEGNPDPAGSQKLNKTLSLKRAVAIRDAFIELYNIPGGRIQVHAAGETRAAAEINTAAAKSSNIPVLVILYRLEPPAPPTGS
jgi:hypothetical protein